MATLADQDKGSSEAEETDLCHSCSPCETTGKQFTAVGYCVNCEEFLCQRCFDVHRIPSLTRKHELLDMEHVPTGFTEDNESERISRKCPQHDKEVINYHCPGHDFLGCHLCSYKHQKYCKNVLCIPEVCQNLTKTTTYKEFAKKLSGLTTICMQTDAELKREFKTIESSHVKTIADILDFKRQILDSVDSAITGLVEKANTIKDTDLKITKELHDKCNACLKETQKITSMIDLLQGSEADLYISIVKTRDTMKTVEDKTISFVNTSRIHRVSFKANNDILKDLTTPSALGIVTKAGDIQYVEPEPDLKISSETDMTSCRPVSTVVCSNILVISDERNESLKLLDIASKTIVSEFELPFSPLGLCKISDSEVAVALQTKVIFLQTCPVSRIDREFAINSAQHGLGYCDNKLILSCDNPPKVEVLDMQGNVLSTFVNDDQGNSLFRDPYYLTVNPHNKLIYVSNCSAHNVVCMPFNGTVVAKYTDSELKTPFQLITDVNGMVYVCGRNSHNVHQLTENCRKVKVLLTKADGLNYPESISFDELRGKLYVSRGNYNSVKVYTVK